MAILTHSNGAKVTIDMETDERMRQVHIQALHLAQEEILFNAVPVGSRARDLQKDRISLAHQALRDRLLEFKFGDIK